MILSKYHSKDLHCNLSLRALRSDKSPTSLPLSTVYILEQKFLRACFCGLVSTGLWAVWAEQSISAQNSQEGTKSTKYYTAKRISYRSIASSIQPKFDFRFFVDLRVFVLICRTDGTISVFQLKKKKRKSTKNQSSNFDLIKEIMDQSLILLTVKSG